MYRQHYRMFLGVLENYSIGDDSDQYYHSEEIDCLSTLKSRSVTLLKKLGYICRERETTLKNLDSLYRMAEKERKGE